MEKLSTQKEAIRLRSVQWLASQFHKLCGHQLGEKNWFKHFESWLWSARDEDEVTVLPDSEDACYDIDLGNKLLKSKESPYRVASICEQLGLALQSARDRIKSKKRFKNSPIFLEKMDDREKYVLTCTKTSVEITVRHYEKLQDLFDKSRALREKLTFNQVLFCLLARYSSLQGGHHRTGGYQASIHERCFDVLREDFGCDFECFASPFNCNMDGYCSKFRDVDSWFGSSGSFFDFQPKSGCFEANPPFSEKVVLRMTAHMEKLLDIADKTSNALCFVVIIPQWTERESWNKLSKSKWCVKVVHLSQSDHGFCEGTSSCVCVCVFRL